MKKRVLALLLALIMCFTMVPATNAMAVEATTDDTQAQSPAQNFSKWAINDLIIGDSYGTYPLTWYTSDMTVPINQGKLRTLMAGIRLKMSNTGCVTKNPDNTYRLTKYMTVETVLKTFYSVISAYEFTGDIGIKDKTSITFMKENGIYNGKNGELGLKDTCSIEQACVFATRLVTYVYDKLDAASKGFLWVTKSGENTVYMLGSIHMASNDIYPFSTEMLKAYASADALAMELNLFDQQGAAKLAGLGVYTDGTTFKDHVSAETYQKTITLATTFGYPEAQINLLKPWYIYCMFAALTNTESGDKTEAAQAASLGIDVNFTVNAMYFGKPILEIEGYEFQGKVLDSFSDNLEEYLLNGTIDSINELIAGTEDQGSEDLNLMLELWRDGDAESFEKFSSMEYEYPELYGQEKATAEKALIDEFKDKLITQRDKKMAEYIDTLLKAEGSSTYFVVVGSGHYISDYSVLDILDEKGYEISQIK